MIFLFFSFLLFFLKFTILPPQDEADESELATFRKEIEESMSKLQDPFPRAESFSVHEIIDPRETRKYLAQWAERIQPQLKAKLLRLK